MQWKSCLACSSLHFGYLVPENVRQLSLLSLGQLACQARPLNYLDMLVLHRAHVPCTHACVMHARCDITRFIYDMIAFHLCHVGMRWYDVIGVCIV